MLASLRSLPPNQIGPALLQIADHDAVVMPLADRDLVDADHFGRGCAARAASCSRMYCFSSRLTVCQSRCSSSATSLIVLGAAALGPRSRQSAWCTARCRQEISSRSRFTVPHRRQQNAAAPPGRGKCGGSRRTDPVPAAARGRTSQSAPCRKSRRRFFPRRTRRDEPRVRITEDPADALQGTKTAEPICIRQTADFACLRHRAIMPNSRYPGTDASHAVENRLFSSAAPLLLPTRNHEEPKEGRERE